MTETKIRYRFSLGFLLCSTALVAVAISHGIASWRLKTAQSEIAWLKNARNTSWPDPNGISVVSLDSPNSGFKPENKMVIWHWKIMSPQSSSLRLRWDALPQTLEVAPSVIDRDTDQFIEIPSGTIELIAMIRETADKEMHVTCTIAGKQHDFTFKSDSRLFDEHGFLQKITGVRETEIGDPKKPFLMSCLRGFASGGVPSHGTRFWIEPTP